MSAKSRILPSGIGLLEIDNAPLNALSRSVISSIREEILKMRTHSRGFILTGSGKTFCAGVDINDFVAAANLGRKAISVEQLTAPFHELVNLLDSSPVPVLAAIHGQALGGGCELCLGCHYRVALESAQIGQPEVKLGLLPGAQGTQRLPRLLSLENAAKMCLTGEPVKANKALKIGLIDAIVTQSQISELMKVNNIASDVAFVTHCEQLLLNSYTKVKPVSMIAVPITTQIAVAAGALDQALVAGSKMTRGFNAAPEAIVRCIKAAASNPKKIDYSVEAAEFFELLFSIESASLRHTFFSTRLCKKLPTHFLPKMVKSSTTRPAKFPINLGVVGAGFMGVGIAFCFLCAGCSVIIKDATEEAGQKGLASLKSIIEGRVKKGSIQASTAHSWLNSRVRTSTCFKDFSSCDLVIEAVPEILNLKQSIFKEVEQYVRSDCILASNTSGLDLTEVFSGVKEKGRTVGLHFFSPAHVMKLLEIVASPDTSSETLAWSLRWGESINKVSVVVGNCDGFVGNRMLAPYAAESRVLLEDGASVTQVDQAVEKFGMVMGPLALGDLVGLELFYKARKAAGDMTLETKTFMGPYELVDWLVEKGRWGTKTKAPEINASGRGFYIYKGNRREVDPEIDVKLQEIRATKLTGMDIKKFTDDDIVERVFFPLINEGCRILEEGMAARSGDIDVIYVYGYGFPAQRGGPMFWAEQLGLDYVVSKLQHFDMYAKAKSENYPAAKCRGYFEPCKLLKLAASRGVSIDEAMLLLIKGDY